MSTQYISFIRGDTTELSIELYDDTGPLQILYRIVLSMQA